MEIYCSTGAFVGKVNNRNFRLIPPVSEKLNCTGFEFMFEAWYDCISDVESAIIPMISETKNFPVIHLDKDIGEFVSADKPREAFEKFEINCALGQKLGCGKAVLHLWGGLSSDKHFELNFNAYPEFERIAKEYNIRLTIENVPCNTGDPLDHLEALQEAYRNVAFTIDTRFLAFHDEFEKFYNSPLISSVRHIHISDWVAAPMQWDRLRPIPQPGEGNIDFERFFSFLHKNSFNGSVTLESPAMFPGYTDTDVLNESLAYLNHLAND